MHYSSSQTCNEPTKNWMNARIQHAAQEVDTKIAIKKKYTHSNNQNNEKHTG